MRLAKATCLAILAALAAMTLLGASQAMAEETTLCEVHEESCLSEDEITNVHLVNDGIVTLLSSLATILCLSTLISGEALEAGSPQTIDTTSMSVSSCGTNSTHSNCTVTVEEAPDLSLLRTGLNLGEAETVDGQVRVQCTIIFIVIDCSYSLAGMSLDAEGASHTESAGNGMLTASDPVTLIEGTGLCPAEVSLDALLEPLAETNISQKNFVGLCKKHTSPKCGKDDHTTNLELNLTEATKFLVKIDDKDEVLSCANSTIKLDVLGLDSVIQYAHFAAGGFAWSGCTMGGKACKDPEVQQLGSDVLIKRTNLNLGTAKFLASKVLFQCGDDDKKLNCILKVEPTLNIEGAKDTVKAGNGRFFGTFATVGIDKGTVCPTTVMLDASYEATAEFYVLF